MDYTSVALYVFPSLFIYICISIPYIFLEVLKATAPFGIKVAWGCVYSSHEGLQMTILVAHFCFFDVH